MANRGVLVELKKEQLQDLGEFKNGCSFIPTDFSETILFLKPKDGKKHEYFIPSLHKSNLQNLSDAIYTFLRQEGKNRTKLTITDERSGIHDFFVGDSIFDVGRKICSILIGNLHV